MRIEIRDPELEARIQRQVRATGGTVEDVLLRLLDTQEEQDRWLAENRAAIDRSIRAGIGELDRGEGIPDTELRGRMNRMKRRR